MFSIQLEDMICRLMNKISSM